LAACGGPRAWTLAQVDAARAQSQTPPVIAPEWAGFLAPLPELFALERQEREARRLAVENAKDPNTHHAARQSADAAKPLSLPQATPDMTSAPAAAAIRALDFAALAEPQHFSRRVSLQAAAWRLAAIGRPEVENPLLARMTEFWFNHFNVFNGKGGVRPFVGHYVVQAIRANALGRFEDLLLATARHPAMLRYLDQAQSVAEGSPGAQGQRRGLNENYAREVMELHTLGVNGGYTQTDVRELARVLTGWTVGPQHASGFRFAPRLHDSGIKTVLGQRFPAQPDQAGEDEGIAALRMLAHHPATAQRIALRLARFFVADTPPPELVHSLAQRFMDSNGDIAAVLRHLFASDAFWAGEHRLFKTPLDYAGSCLTVMAAATEPNAVTLTLNFLSAAGQPLHGWPTPDGYAFDAATWMVPEALTRRADYAFALTRGRAAPTVLDPFLSSATRAAIAAEHPARQAALRLVAPEFMMK
ncbi:MAG: DUF1800 domain-containing protein, partial [Tepidimonas sp.]|uniref:DUF1800 domain-containing protein n=1 Tax=Tepidimonas sp. TaxID=2002775 RepID=UPI004054B5FB